MQDFISQREEEFDEKFGEMLKHRLYHYGLEHYKSIGREPTKKEQDDCWQFAEWQVKELQAFNHQTITGLLEKFREILNDLVLHTPLHLSETQGRDYDKGYIDYQDMQNAKIEEALAQLPPTNTDK